jgi:tetratricopeptide (TPR) repeat protein
MDRLIPSSETFLAELGIEQATLKLLTPKWKRTQYRAVINWLSKYKPQPYSPTLEQLRGCLEAFHHLCAVDAWEKAANLIRRGVPVTTATEPLNSSEDIYLEEALHSQLGDFGYYREQINLCSQILGKVNDEVDDICLNSLGLAHRALGNYQKAIECHKQQLKLAPAPESQASSLTNLGNIYGSLRQYTVAMEFYEQALAIFLTLSNEKGYGKILGNIGVIYRLQENYEQAIESHRQHLEIAHNIDDRQGIANAIENLGIVYYFLGDYQKAAENMQWSLSIARKTGNRRNKASTLGSLGNVYSALQNHSLARDLYQQQLELSHEIGYLEGEKTALGNLGVVCHSTGQYDTAIKYYERGLAIARNIGDKQGESYALSNLGNTYTCLEQYETAIEYHKQSLGIAAGIGDKWAAGAAIHNLSDAYRLLKQFELAALLGMRSLYIFACIQSPEVETAMITLSKIALEIGLDEYAELIEEQLHVIEQEEDGEHAVAGLRKLLFDN